MSSVLEVRELRVFRGKRPLTHPVSFTLAFGEVLRITGDNGRGKTTLVESLIGLYGEWRGSIDLRTKSVSYKRQVVPAFFSLKLCEIGPLLIGFDQEKFGEVLDLLQLRAFWRRPIGLLSGGEAQRAMLALALARRHDLLVLDEPFGGVDDHSASLIRACLLQDLAARATIIVEHRTSLDFPVTRVLSLEHSGD